jgi:hypothetical protein
MPTVNAVMNTPIVESEIPCHAIGFMTCQLVSRPPENKMKLRAMTPMNCAMLILSNKYRNPFRAGEYANDQK